MQHLSACFHYAVRILRWFAPSKFVPWVRWLVFDRLLRRSGFDGGQSILNELWTEWHWNTFFSEYLGFPLSTSCHPWSILVFIYMLLLPERKRTKRGNQDARLFRKAKSIRQKITFTFFFFVFKDWRCRSQWPRGLRRGSSAVRLLGLWVRIPPGAWMCVCCECCVLSGRYLCVGLITRPEESYRLWCGWMWSWSVDNEEALVHRGLLCHGKKKPEGMIL